MKIVFTSNGGDLSSGLDPRFGRAMKFLAYDLENDSIEVFDNNQNLNAAQGAGIQAAQNVCELGANAVITGHCGPKAFAALSAAGVAVYCCSAATVGEALEAYKNGSLQVSNGADVDGHWV